MTREKNDGGPRLLDFAKDEIYTFLRSRTEPVSEAALLKHLTGLRFLSDGGEDLYSLHFSLYHALHSLRRDDACRGMYLHLDPMRIRLVETPEPSRCSHYFPEEGSYCGRPAERRGLCSYHASAAPGDADLPLYDPMDDFYLNPENIAFGASPLLEKITRGIIVYSLRRGEVEAALRFFGIAGPSRRVVQKRYYELARKYHPDLEKGNDEMMKLLNSHYQVLREIFIV